MKLAILVTARLGSTRLSKKHMIQVLGRPILSYLIERIENEFRGELDHGEVEIIIATSDEPENRAFEQFSKKGVKVFYGSINNIPFRHLQCVDVHHLDGVITVDGDDILCSVAGMKAVFKALKMGASYVKTTNLPFGMNSCGYSRDFLRHALEGHKNEILETGWGRIFDESKTQLIAFPSITQNDQLRFTLDYEEDLKFFKAVIQSLRGDTETASDQTIVATVIKDHLFQINGKLFEQYWSNFQNNLRNETEQS